MDDKLLCINEDVTIPISDLRFRFSRSSGPGGQNVNRVETRVELRFDLARSPVLTEEQRQRALQALSSYIDSEGVLHLVSQSFRSQHQNREAVIRRFQALLQKALRVPKRRRPTQTPPRVRERRLEEKHRRTEAKRGRQSPRSDEEA